MNRGLPAGVASVVVTEDDDYIVADNIETPRMREEFAEGKHEDQRRSA